LALTISMQYNPFGRGLTTIYEMIFIYLFIFLKKKKKKERKKLTQVSQTFVVIRLAEKGR